MTTKINGSVRIFKLCNACDYIVIFNMVVVACHNPMFGARVLLELMSARSLWSYGRNLPHQVLFPQTHTHCTML